MKRGPLPKLSPEQVADIFERLTCTDVCIKELSIDYGVHRSTIETTIKKAKVHGLDLWRRNTWRTNPHENNGRD